MNSLQDYKELFSQLNLTELSVEEGDFKLFIKREVSAHANQVIADTANVVIPPVEKKAENEAPIKKVEGTEVKAPLLGIFYGTVGDRPALKVGDNVKSGDVLCTIEAMKMMNEVNSPVDGVIKAVCVTEGTLVEYNQTLFVIG
ncbi:acetyl-CoA carboxylase biotin carboxyl carrier protein [Butyrivibrio sp. INlla21]|uniref:acetyl-CoA carboxylase biotin carboxyl carrier protein n=1 Tax=Butyrivibrio sp. INlla21 TaxID=1520811 RepID=UPI0008E0BF35|nr:acetyl-CoA carboxylase biotin carboxyl carrier protein subunit [Butyrivibrio sp. INlla21]SFU94514.1 acetyl-CoA carboxylase biotin carboxyl carrier protein [Butyrivibrio sp. INlla21]